MSGSGVATTVTIGYDTPWRQVHAMLEEAARRESLRRLGKVTDQALQRLTARLSVVAAADVPGGDETQPFGPVSVRLVGKV